MFETTNITNIEQLMFCLRYVNGELNRHEEFIGLHGLESTTTQNITTVHIVFFGRPVLLCFRSVSVKSKRPVCWHVPNLTERDWKRGKCHHSYSIYCTPTTSRLRSKEERRSFGRNMATSGLGPWSRKPLSVVV